MLLAASATLTPFSVNNFYLEKDEIEEMRRMEQACLIRRPRREQVDGGRI